MLDLRRHFSPRHAGSVYRASDWTRVGATYVRERFDTNKRYDKPQQDIWLGPLRKDRKCLLNR